MDKETILNDINLDDPIYNKTIDVVAPNSPEIGIDINNDLLNNMINAYQVSQMDVNKLQSFTNVTRNRNELYDTLDYMAQDTTLASVLETYAEDATEMNDSGDIVWCESEDSNCAKYITFLLNSLNVNKNVFRWTHSLCKYGDVYLRLYRESEVEDRFFAKVSDSVNNKRRNTLNEDVTIRAYKKNDRYIHYLEQADNPAQVFELTRFGKTAGYVKTNIQATPMMSDGLNTTTMYGGNRYRFSSASNDVELFPATEWVHGCLESDNTRSPEEVELFNDSDATSSDGMIYKVKRGESLLYDSYKTWRELMLLENSVLLQRVTQSSIVRVVSVEVGDMPKENVQPHLMNIKNLIEQKAALDVGRNMSEYTNPGPIVNNIYIPTRNNQGVISTQQIGGDVNVGDLVDLGYYEDKLFGGLRVPKQYFGRVDDAAGFSGGSSLSIISSRYAKMIKRIQNVIIQMLTDAINLILIDTDNEQYINKFTLRMLAPTTQEEVDRRSNLNSKVDLVSNIMNSLSEMDDVEKKLRILKSLLSDTITNTEVISIIQEKIDEIESERLASEAPEEESEDTYETSSEDIPLDDLFTDDSSDSISDSEESVEESFDGEVDTQETLVEEKEEKLPTPEELNAGDFSDNTNSKLY